jgi:hypothetical protein
MINTYTYRIFKKWKLIIVYYGGELNISDLKNLRSNLKNESDYSPKFDVINDLRECNLQMNVNEIEGYSTFLKNELQIIYRRKLVFLTSKPNEVVLTHLLSDALRDISILGNIFTTSQAGLKWLSNQNLDFECFEKIIDEMKTQPNTQYT